jgi:GNAT superfamily N-acetyltransferase
MNVERSIPDSKRFKVSVARAHLCDTDAVHRALEECRANNIELLIARCSTEHIAVAQEMERRGFLLMDTLVYFACPTTRTCPPVDSPALVREFEPSDFDQMRAIAADCFRGYFGHYHADARLDPALADAGYVEWVETSCRTSSRDGAVLVAVENARVVGFITLRRNSPEEIEGMVIAVARDRQMQKVAQALMHAAVDWCRAVGAARMIISTQVNNLKSQKSWIRQGFEPYRSTYTFHWWSPENGD